MDLDVALRKVPRSLVCTAGLDRRFCGSPILVLLNIEVNREMGFME